MKFLMFADLHHYPGVYDGGDWEDLKEIQQKAEENGCSFIIHAGDFCHGAAKVRDYVEAYNSFHIPSYHCLGNHDTDETSLEETLKIYQMPSDHYFFDCEGYRVIVANPNYYKDGDEYVPYSLGNYYSHPNDLEYIPPEQMQWLKETVETSPYPCIVITHQSFEQCNGVQNRAEVQAIFNEANRKKKHSVLMCLNGHYHRDFVRILDNICYWDVNSASFDPLEAPHDLYPEELCKKFKVLRHIISFTEPLYAIVTLERAHIKVEGKTTEYLMGITREMTGNPPFNKSGRPLTPSIKSFDITLG